MNTHTVEFDLSQVLNYPITLRINGWHSDQPLHWASFNDDSLVAEGLFLEAPGLPLFRLGDDNGLRLCDAIPDEINAVCRLMPAMDFQLAQACAVSQAAREMAREAPLLLLLAVDYARQQPLSVVEFEQLLARKRADILRAAGLAGSKSLARLVGRLNLSPMMPWELDDVHRALKQPDFLPFLRHHPDLHLNHLRLLLRVRRPLWPGLLYLVNEHTQPADLTWTCRMIRDTLNLAGGNEQVFAQVNSRETLQDQHDRFIGLFNRQNHRNKSWVVGEVRASCNANPSPDALERVRRWVNL